MVSSGNRKDALGFHLASALHFTTDNFNVLLSTPYAKVTK